MSDDLGFDEKQAVDFIRKTLPEQLAARVTDDDILDVVDIVWEWYEKEGYTSLDNVLSADEEEDMSGLSDYVYGELQSDGELKSGAARELSRDDVELLVRGELQYEESIDSFI